MNAKCHGTKMKYLPDLQETCKTKPTCENNS